MQQTYQCANCGAPVTFGVMYCGNCRTLLNWSTPQQSQNPPTYQRTSGNYPIQQQEHNENKQQSNVKKKTSPFLIIAVISLVLTIIFLLLLVIIWHQTNWSILAEVFVTVFLGIFAVGTLVLFIIHIINRKQTNPWRTGFVLLILVASWVIIVSIYSANRTSQISSPPPVTSPKPPVTYPTPVVKPAPIRHDVPLKEIVNNPAYWNMAWQEKHAEMQGVCRRINQQYLTTHTYIKGETDCNDMAIDIWNMLQTEGITSILVAGNIDIPNPTFAQCNHTFLELFIFDKENSKPNYFFLEPTNGEVYFYEDAERNPQLKNYEWGYFYIKPSDLREDFKERW